MSEAKTVYRPIPCPRYDVEGMQLWLEDMAAKGLHFVKDSFFLGFATFEVGEKKKVRYRLEPTEKQLSAMDTHAPEHEQLELAQKFGWEFVGTSGQNHYIFRTEDEDAREMNTDPEVQAFTLKKLRKRQVSDLISVIITAVIYPLITMHGKLMLFLIMPGPWITLSAAAVILWTLAHRVAALVYTTRYRKRLLEGDEAKQRTAPKGSGYMLERTAFVLAWVAWSIGLVVVLLTNLGESNKVLLEDFDGDVPFITLQEILPEGEYAVEDFWRDNSIIEWSNFITPYNAEYYEYGTVQTESGEHSGSYSANFHIAANEHIANLIAKAYRHKDGIKKTQLIDADELGVDYAYTYVHDIGLLIQNGCEVIHVTFTNYGENKITTHEWHAIIADSMK